MIANYFIVDDFLLNRLQKLDSIKFNEQIEKIINEEENYPCCDLDTIWNGLYFLLSSNEMPVYDKQDFSNYCKSAFIFGDIVFNTEDYISYINKEEIKSIVEEIEKIQFENLKFEPKLFAEKDIFPNVWLKEEKEILFDEMEMAFDELKQFFIKAKNENNNILITIM